MSGAVDTLRTLVMMASEQTDAFKALAIKYLSPYETVLAYLALGVMACVPIVYGARASVEAALNAAKDVERVSHQDALWFPVLASGVLVGFYVLFKYFSQEYINYLLTAYFGIFGVISLTQLLDACLTPYIPSRVLSFHEHTVTVDKRGEREPVFKLVVNLPRILFLLASIVTLLAYALTKHWVLNDVLGMSFALTAITLMHLDSFRTGFLMLGLLFVYDVFWVFKTDVMVTVARAFDVPVKLLMPRHVADYFVARPTQASLLGLGDIVIPGIFLALARRFDAHQSKADSAKKEHDGGKFQYFSFAMAAYILGLACTVLVMHFWQAAQPALLYLSPACSLAVVLCALLNGELQAMWSYTTEASDDDDAVKRKQRKPAAKKGVAKRQPGYKGEESGADDDDDDGNNDDDGQEMEAAKTTGKRRPVRSAAKAD